MSVLVNKNLNKISVMLCFVSWDIIVMIVIHSCMCNSVLNRNTCLYSSILVLSGWSITFAYLGARRRLYSRHPLSSRRLKWSTGFTCTDLTYGNYYACWFTNINKLNGFHSTPHVASNCLWFRNKDLDAHMLFRS